MRVSFAPVSWIVSLWEAVGPITRGMTRAEVRSKVHSRFEPFLKGDAVTTTGTRSMTSACTAVPLLDAGPIEYVQCQSTLGSVVLTLRWPQPVRLLDEHARNLAQERVRDRAAR